MDDPPLTTPVRTPTLALVLPVENLKALLRSCDRRKWACLAALLGLGGAGLAAYGLLGPEARPPLLPASPRFEGLASSLPARKPRPQDGGSLGYAAQALPRAPAAEGSAPAARPSPARGPRSRFSPELTELIERFNRLNNAYLARTAPKRRARAAKPAGGERQGGRQGASPFGSKSIFSGSKIQFKRPRSVGAAGNRLEPLESGR